MRRSEHDTRLRTVEATGRFLGLMVLAVFFAALLPVVDAGEPIGSPLSRDSAARLFAKGNELYTEAKRLAAPGAPEEGAKSKFSDAEVCYERILDGGFVGWQVFYNLGNAFYQQGALGKAIACYRRAQRLAPRQEDVQINLEKAKAEARDKEAAPRAPDFVRALLFPYFKLNIDEVTIAGIIAYLLFGGVLTLGVFVPSAWARWLCGIALAASIVLGTTLAAKVLLEERVERGVVISSVCAVRFGPGAEYPKRFEAHEGAEFVVLARSKDARTGEEWLKVLLFIELRQGKPTPPEAAAEEKQPAAEGWVELKHAELL